MELQALGSMVWVVLASLLIDAGQAVVDIPIGVDRLSVLRRYGGCITRFTEEACYHLFRNTLQSLNFTGGALHGKTPTDNCCFVSVKLMQASVWFLREREKKERERGLLLCFNIILKGPCFNAIYNVPDATRSSFIEFLQHRCALLNPTPLLVFKQVMRDPMGATLLNAEMIMGEHCSHFPMKCPVHLVSLHMLFSGLP